MADLHHSREPGVLAQAHRPEAIAARLDRGPGANYLRDAIYGAIDGAVTTFAVVSGVVGGGLPVAIIIVLGMANLLADGFSMAASNYLGTRSELERRERLRREEHRHIREVPEGEREEIRQIFRRKGFEGETLERAVEAITSDEQRWVETMLQEEYGVPAEEGHPLIAALVTFAAFLLVGSVPLMPFLVGLLSSEVAGIAFELSVSMTAVAFFIVGAIKGRYVEQPWYRSGIETFLLGAAAAGLAYGVGVVLGDLGARG
jgi:vacuolar iron transporter family protein